VAAPFRPAPLSFASRSAGVKLCKLFAQCFIFLAQVVGFHMDQDFQMPGMPQRFVFGTRSATIATPSGTSSRAVIRSRTCQFAGMDPSGDDLFSLWKIGFI
jgi:hypothetical protein